jgi:hypothetical protein
MFAELQSGCLRIGGNGEMGKWVNGKEKERVLESGRLGVEKEGTEKGSPDIFFLSFSPFHLFTFFPSFTYGTLLFSRGGGGCGD